MNVAALEYYRQAQLPGNRQRDAAVAKIHDGIAEFCSLRDALRDAEERIEQYTCSNFQLAHFYELVRSEALRKIYGDSYGICISCHHWRDGGCSNLSSDVTQQLVFSAATAGSSCGNYYPVSL